MKPLLQGYGLFSFIMDLASLCPPSNMIVENNPLPCTNLECLTSV
jgi:hypothetical protein